MLELFFITCFIFYCFLLHVLYFIVFYYMFYILFFFRGSRPPIVLYLPCEFILTAGFQHDQDLSPRL